MKVSSASPKAIFLMQSYQSIADVEITVDVLGSAVSAINDASEGNELTLESCVKAIIEALFEMGIEDQQELVELGSAICARLMAFATLAKTRRAEHWLGTQSSSIATFNKPFLEAMARTPLELHRGRYEFNSEFFFEIVLERSPSAGCC